MSGGKYRVKRSFRGPKQGSSNPILYKEFKEGMMFSGEEDPDNKPPLVKDSEGFIIPMEYTDYIEDKSAPVATSLSEQISEKIDKIKNKDMVKEVLKKSNYSMNGAMIAGSVGLILAIYFKKPVLWCTIGAAIGGGIIGGFISNKNK